MHICLEPYFPDITDALSANGHNSFILNPNFSKFKLKIESQDVYFPMEQTLLKHFLWFKNYDQNIEQMSLFKIVFKAITTRKKA